MNTLLRNAGTPTPGKRTGCYNLPWLGGAANVDTKLCYQNPVINMISPNSSAIGRFTPQQLATPSVQRYGKMLPFVAQSPMSCFQGSLLGSVGRQARAPNHH